MKINESQALTCIGCPVGCTITVTKNQDGEYQVTGNQCAIGDRYGKSEVSNPVRMITSSVFVENGQEALVSVKTQKSIPKGLMFDVAKALTTVKVVAPVHIGDVIVENVCDTGVNIIATSTVLKRN